MEQDKIISRHDYHDNGEISCIEYYNDYGIHKEDGPAQIHYYMNGKKRKETYYINNKIHNDKNAAVVFYFPNGKKQGEFFFYNNDKIEVSSLEEFLLYVEEQKVKEYLL
jgi:antitoxin component YwqK of YwqJK toxin-antitoxin module